MGFDAVLVMERAGIAGSVNDRQRRSALSSRRHQRCNCSTNRLDLCLECCSGEMHNLHIWIDRLCWGRIAIIAWYKMHMQVRDRIAKQLEVHFDWLEHVIKSLSSHGHIVKELKTWCACEEMIGLLNVLVADEDTIAGHELIARQAQPTHR